MKYKAAEALMRFYFETAWNTPEFEESDASQLLEKVFDILLSEHPMLRERLSWVRALTEYILNGSTVQDRLSNLEQITYKFFQRLESGSELGGGEIDFLVDREKMFHVPDRLEAEALLEAWKGGTLERDAEHTWLGGFAHTELGAFNYFPCLEEPGYLYITERFHVSRVYIPAASELELIWKVWCICARPSEMPDADKRFLGGACRPDRVAVQWITPGGKLGFSETLEGPTEGSR